jgi:hypothetical protein
MLTSSRLIFAIVSILVIATTGCSSGPTVTESQPQKSASSLENQLLRQSGDTPENGKIYVVKDGKRHWIVYSSWIGAHASELSGGVQEIDAARLEAIPIGDPITAKQ